MDAYSELDATIEACVAAHSSQLFTEWASKPARYFHIPGDPPFECFQVSVEPPSPCKVAVFVRAIDTNDDTENELERRLEGSVKDLSRILDDAIHTINGWKLRQRMKPDPPSPW